jgi:hypothetical protein
LTRAGVDEPEAVGFGDLALGVTFGTAGRRDRDAGADLTDVEAGLAEAVTGFLVGTWDTRRVEVATRGLLAGAGVGAGSVVSTLVSGCDWGWAWGSVGAGSGVSSVLAGSPVNLGMAGPASSSVVVGATAGCVSSVVVANVASRDGGLFLIMEDGRGLGTSDGCELCLRGWALSDSRLDWVSNLASRVCTDARGRSSGNGTATWVSNVRNDVYTLSKLTGGESWWLNNPHQLIVAFNIPFAATL